MDPTAHPLTPRAGKRFRSLVERGGLRLDGAQLTAIEALSAPAPRGFYLWGEVGRGKTMLAERYFEALPTSRTRRLHFHGFFRELQARIVQERVPLERTLRRFFDGTRAVLFDEFHVHDVADGLYLAATLRHLLDEGILLIATSNYSPEALMPDPLFHPGFVPTIELIRAKLNVVHLGDGEDYRLRGGGTGGFASGSWTIVSRNEDPSARRHGSVTPAPARLLSAPASDPLRLDAAGLPLAAHRLADGSIAVTFAELCEKPVGTHQYLWLAENLSRLTVTGVPELSSAGRNPLARFAGLIDVLHDRGIQLDVQAEGEPSRILDAPEPPPDAPRAVSRLATLRRP